MKKLNIMVMTKNGILMVYNQNVAKLREKRGEEIVGYKIGCVKIKRYSKENGIHTI